MPLAFWRLPHGAVLEQQLAPIFVDQRNGGEFGSNLAAVLAGLSLYLLFDLEAVLWWLAGIVCLNALAFLAVVYAPRFALGTRGRFWLQLAIFASAGVGWGILPLLALHDGQAMAVLFVTTVIAVHCAASYAVASTIVPLFSGFLLPSTLPLTLATLMSGEGVLLVTGLVMSIFILCMLLFAVQSQRNSVRSIELGFENLELVSQLRAESEALRLARQEAEQANRDKSRFLAAASHDLRQPLHALGLFLEALSRTALEGRQREILENAVAVSSSARHMLNTLLDYSRLEAGVIEPRACNFRVQTLFSKLEQEMGPQADRKGLVYRCRDSSLAAHADPALIELILRNLISNAIRYTDQGGLLIACRRRSSTLFLEVWDSGVGIAAEEQAAVFHEFYQVGNPERDRRKGLGLGLAIVKGLCAAMGMQLELVSRPGRGSMFRLIVPAAIGGIVVEPMARPLPLHSFEDLHVLVVDDDEAVRQAMVELLGSWGCRCLVAESVEQALAVCGQLPQLLLLDYRLRDQQTGGDVMAALRRRFGSLPPTLIITGDTAPDRLREAQATGAILVHKPVDVHRLHEVMRQVIQSEAGL